MSNDIARREPQDVDATVVPVPVSHAGNDPAPQYMQGFDGASIQPFPKEIADKLLADFDDADVEVKPDGIVFLPGEWYRRRLTESFGPGGWAIGPRGPVRTRSNGGGELVIYHGALLALGRYVGEAYGECTYWPRNAGMTYGDAIEGATTNCEVRCCKRLGMASKLWNKAWREQWLARYAYQENGKWYKRPVRSASAAPTGTANSNASAAPTSPAPSAATTAAPATAGAASPKSAAKHVTKKAPPSTTTRRSSVDTGEAADEKSINDLRVMILETLKWPRQRAVNWTLKHFGVDSLNAFTKLQVKTAFELLFAMEQGEAAYEAALSVCLGDGRVVG